MNLKFIFILSLLIFILPINSFAQEGWFWQNPLPQGNILSDIQVFNDSTAIAIGSPNTIVKTVNGGGD